MQPFRYIMSKLRREYLAAALPWLCAMAALAHAQSSTERIVTNVSMELVVRSADGGPADGGPADHGAPLPKLTSAERVVPGDVLIYTVEVRNAGRYAAESPVVVQPIPNHTMYIADSAVGPGVDVDYSVDGGHTFDTPENLKVAGATARATAADYTHIRWHLRNRLKPNSVAYVRFRAQVK
jgi:uncharacterized repeat protein (TIGR01451 family)